MTISSFDHAAATRHWVRDALALLEQEATRSADTHLLRLDFPGALRANAVLLALLLPGTIWGAVHAVRYVRTGDGSVRRWERALLWGAVGVLLAGGVLRNLPAFAFLAPH